MNLIFQKQKLVYDGTIERYFKILQRLNDALIIKKSNTIENKYSFLAALDYIDTIENQSDELKYLLDVRICYCIIFILE